MKPNVKKVSRAVINVVCEWLSVGRPRVACPICQWSGRTFVRIAYPCKPADCFACPKCGSGERHRFAYIALKDVLAGHQHKTLHFAPEPCLQAWLRSISGDYLSVDLASRTAMERMDICNLRFENARFSLLWCSHVLEHVNADRKALEEMARVLIPSGIAVVMVPVYGSTTYENPDVTTPAERLVHFKQEDHVRLYGLDIVERMQTVGFNVRVIRTADMPACSVARYGLEYPSTREIFLCTKE